MNHKPMKTPDQILKEHEDANEMSFYQIERVCIIKAMEEYARTVQPWIRPKDQMPQDCEPVLITDNEGLQIVAWRDKHTDKWHSENHTWFTHEVLCWMPIPEIV